MIVLFVIFKKVPTKYNRPKSNHLPRQTKQQIANLQMQKPIKRKYFQPH